jgi:predicted site-specific integrase-resolvase
MQTQTKIRRWFSKRQLSDRYGVSTRSIERWVEAGKFPAGTQWPNKRWYWSDREIEAYERSLIGARETPKSTGPELGTAAG